MLSLHQVIYIVNEALNCYQRAVKYVLLPTPLAIKKSASVKKNSYSYHIQINFLDNPKH